MRFAIVDDNKLDIENVRDKVKEWGECKGIDTTFLEFDSAEAFLFSYEDVKNYDVLLLDIEMKDMDGVEMAKRIRKVDSDVVIIFITGYSDYILDGYDVGALNYLMKPLDKEKFFRVLDTALTKLESNSKSIILSTNEEISKVQLNSISYIDVDRNYIMVHADKNYRVKRTLGSIEEELDERFLRIGRSALINIEKVIRVTRTDVFLNTNETVPLPRGAYEKVNRAIINMK